MPSNWRAARRPSFSLELVTIWKCGVRTSSHVSVCASAEQTQPTSKPRTRATFCGYIVGHLMDDHRWTISAATSQRYTDRHGASKGTIWRGKAGAKHHKI